jgi:tryptophan 6-halogenase
MTTAPPLKIVILGGGTAGWMTACLLVQAWGTMGANITLLESPDVGIIGVGEGSTPQLRAFFQKLGLAEADWMPRCNATYKNGISFKGWSDRGGYGDYYHPFATAVDDQTLPIFLYNTRARRTGRDVWAHPDRFFLPAYLSEKKYAPLPDERFPFDVSYGYHFDAYLVGEVLRDHARSSGVHHKVQHIAKTEMTETGNIAALVAENGEWISGDLFIDCSGFRGALIQEALGERFISFAENLFNDSAVVMPTAADPVSLAPHTTATAMTAGWRWDIPLTNRTGNGYVYASRYLSADQAETELRTQLGLLESDVTSRHLKMKVGRVDRSWVNNCLAVGLAQGFIEPLEATALHIVQGTVEGFIDAYGEGGFSSKHRDVFNADIARRYDGIRDYIVCHYKVNGRKGLPYWQDAAAVKTISDPLKAVLTAWYTGADLSAEIERLDIGRYYSTLSWHCLLAGYGVFPDDTKIQPAGSDIQQFDLAKVDEFIRRCGLNFRDNKQVIESFASHAIKAPRVA